MAGKYGVVEFTDTLGDIVEAAAEDGLRSAFDGNFEILKFLIEAADEYPNIKEMIDDIPTFALEAGDLQPEEKDEVMTGLRARFPNPDPVQAKILEFYDTAGFGFVWIVRDVIGGGRELVARVVNLFGGVRS